MLQLLAHIYVASFKTKSVFHSHISERILISVSFSRHTCIHMHSEVTFHVQSYK